jgi:Zn-dependent protease with chaperone function
MLRYYEPEEVFFIISHECGHVYHNHTISNLLFSGVEKTLRGENNKYGYIIDLVKIAYIIPNKLIFNELLPMDGAYLKSKEIQADEFALSQTLNLSSAVKCLTHICNSDLDRKSHWCKTANLRYGVMTMRERISELIKRDMMRRSQYLSFQNLL